MSDEWPIAAQPADRPVDPARAAGRDRLATVRADFFLPEQERLTEQERALMTTMLDDLVTGLADSIGAEIGGDLGGEPTWVVGELMKAKLVDRPGLVALLLARADEQRIMAAIRGRAGLVKGGVAQQLAGDTDGAIAEGAMALVVARGRRRDRFGRMRIEFDDLAPDDAVALVHAIAAALALRFSSFDPQAHRRLPDAADRLASRHDSRARLEARVAQLASVLDQRDRIDEPLLLAMAADGDVSLLVHCLALRASIDRDVAWSAMVHGGDGQMVLLLRLARVGRDTSARLLAELDGLVGIDDPVGELARYDRLSEASLADARHWWQAAADYRLAVNALEKARG